MGQTWELYEQKILKDKEFPFQIYINKVNKKSCYFSPHWHEHIEMHYVASGECRIMLDQEEVHAHQGDLVIANSNVLHSGYCDGTPVEEMYLIFALEDISGELAEKNVIFPLLVKNQPEISQMMLKIREEYENQDIGWHQACKGGLLQALACLVRHEGTQMLSDSASIKRRKNLERFNTVNRYIGEHYMEPISNAQLANMIHLSEDRFNHLFKESMGMPPLQYINEIRLKKAMSLLKKGEFTATEVADAVGFSDYNHFGRMFRRHFGCTPMEAKENIHKSK
ncbi:MAG: AraC family transcriptional regulator [Clostridiales bacterium]|nr:AraC family transcriptional regulator [Clostridiales bacterium]